ncbi:ABC transporter ATP-binding protein [Streptomyces sp. NPDC096311]|uniref:ABC transporter ATP-binding protein n=1 Tax=Streptomyces sp. NPDC096311 TaxID=3366083 RepID=UPI00382F4B42
MTALLRVTGLRKVFNVRGAEGEREELVAVDSVSFDVPPRGSLAVVGESGSGKTTVARLVAGLEEATSGTVHFSGEPLARTARGKNERLRRARKIQMVFQDPYQSLDPRQTIAQLLDELLREHFDWAPERRRRRIEELLEQVGLDARHAASRPRGLSGGQRQRVAIARALALEPQLLILDEAVSALDVSVQAQVLNLLADLRESMDIAFLFISHDLAVVRQVTDDCIVMHRGQIVEQGTTSDILDNPTADYTRRLLDAIPRQGWKPKRRNGLKGSAAVAAE